MANVKISELTAGTSVGDADLVPIVQGGVTKRVPASLFATQAELDTVAGSIATAVAAARAGDLRVALWNGTAYAVGGTTVTTGNRVAGTYYTFRGGPDPNELGLMVDGDDWKDAS